MCLHANADQVGDWGLARSFHDNQRHHTPTVITLWYRPPEVLLRTTRVRFDNQMRRYGGLGALFSINCHGQVCRGNVRAVACTFICDDSQ